MKKNYLVMACVCLLAVAFAACGKVDNEVAESSQVTEAAVETVATEESDLAPVIQPRDDEAVQETSVVESTDDGLVAEAPTLEGEWHDDISGRAFMTVTANADGSYTFDVTWPDSAFSYYTYSITCSENEGGVFAYSNGVQSMVTTDEEGNSTTTVVTENGVGSISILVDGTMEWIEEGDTPAIHEFVKD
ncbi:MAG: hypothetical protein MJ094_01125 [Saccharofermentans sp.]|nr:hypothetical protein [Saccharofermentans sp.]